MKSHYEDRKEHAKKRLNIIKGQLEGLQKMIEEDKYCIDLLNQSLAIQNSLKSLDALAQCRKGQKYYSITSFLNGPDKNQAAIAP